MNRQTKRMMQRQGTDRPRPPERQSRPARQAAAPQRERTSPAQFLAEVRGELRKVVWPTKNEVINSSVVVLICVVFVTAIVFGFDYVSGKFVLFLFG